MHGFPLGDRVEAAPDESGAELVKWAIKCYFAMTQIFGGIVQRYLLEVVAMVITRAK